MNDRKKYVAKPKLGFVEAVKKVLGSMTQVSGRSRRSEYWWFMLAIGIVNVIVSLLFRNMQAVSSVVSLIISLSAVAVTVRRLHDTNHSAIWVYVEFVCSIVMTVYLLSSGYHDCINTVNPDINALMGIIMNPLFWLPAAVGVVTGLVIFIFSLFDSNLTANKYGESPKYVEEDVMSGDVC